MIIKALKLGVLTVDQIAEMAEVSVEYVLQLQNNLDDAAEWSKPPKKQYRYHLRILHLSHINYIW